MLLYGRSIWEGVQYSCESQKVKMKSRFLGIYFKLPVPVLYSVTVNAKGCKDFRIIKFPEIRKAAVISRRSLALIKCRIMIRNMSDQQVCSAVEAIHGPGRHAYHEAQPKDNYQLSIFSGRY